MPTEFIPGSDEEIICPGCKSKFPLHQGLTSQRIDQFEKELEQHSEEIRLRITKEAMKKAEKEFELVKKGLKEELVEKEAAIKEFRENEIELLKEKKKLAEAKEQFELEIQRKMDEERSEIKKQAAKTEAEKFKLIEAEYKKKLSDAEKSNEEMARKLKQGSQQLQGEVQELAIGDMLSGLFHTDEIKDVPKGKRGADIVQIVRNNALDECGKIIYESKRTKSFQKSWLEKLKTDQLNENAEIAVLVSEVLPEGIDRIGVINGIWICDYHSLKGLALLLRDGIDKVNRAITSQANKGDKVNMLYTYLTGNEFRLQLSAIVDGYFDIRESNNRERLAMEKLWKEREMKLDKVLLNMSHFYGSIKGIAGNSIPEIPLLELSQLALPHHTRSLKKGK